jgi:signal transduction histidine kinase/ligand-binding sensor domain-containing protein
MIRARSGSTGRHGPIASPTCRSRSAVAVRRARACLRLPLWLGPPLWLSLSLLLAGTAAALPVAVGNDAVWSPAIERLSSAEGLPSNSLYSVARDRQGFLWFGSDNGLIRYDGKRMRMLRASSDSRPRISSDNASHVFVDRDGELWLGTWGGGLDRIDLAAGELRNWRHDPDDGDSLASNFVQVLYQDRAGTLWIGTGAGLMRWDRDSDRLQRALTANEGPASLGALRIWSIAEAADGRLWLGTDSGLYRFDPASGQATHHRLATAGAPGGLVRMVMVDQRGRLWVAPENGLGRYDEDSGRWIEIPTPTRLAGSLIVNTALAAGQGRYWLGSWSGVWLLDSDRGELVEIGGSGLKQWFPADDVRDLYLDPTGQLWAATRYNGAARIQLDAPRLRLYRSELADIGGGMGSEMVRSVYRGAGRVWVNTDGAVVEVDIDRALFEPVEATRGLRVGRFGPSAFDHDGALFIATVFGPARVRPTTRRVEPIAGLLPAAGVRESNLGFVVRDSQDRLWWSTQREGVVVSNLDGQLLRHHPPGPGRPGTMAGSSASCAFEDSAGRMWLCAGIGLSRWDEDSDRFTTFLHDPRRADSLSHGRVSSVSEDSDGRIWVGTAAGLDLWDEASGGFRHFSPDEGPIAVAAVLEAEPGTLWVASDRRLWRFDSRQLRFIGAPVTSDEQGLLFTDTAALRLDARRLLLGSNRGLLLFDPLHSQPRGYPPPVAITRVRIDGVTTLTPTDADGVETVVLPAHAQMIEIEYAALDFRAPAQHRHAYRLENFDRDWLDVGQQDSTRYTNLAPGNYLFRVRAAGADQVWNEQGAALRIRVLPPWWRDWRIHLVLVALTVLTIVAGTRGYARQLRARERALTRLVEERARIIAQQQQQLAVQEKMASLGTLTAGVAHEINNPSNFIHVGAQNLNTAMAEFHRQLVELAGDDAEPEVLALFESRFGGLNQQLGAICEGAERIRTIVGHLRSFARLDDANRSTCRVDDGLRSTLSLVRTQFSDAVGFDLQLHSEAEIDCWPARLNQVYMNLIVNACQAVIARHGRDPQAARVSLRTADTDDSVQIEIADNGIGIQPENLSRIFEPFFTTKDVGEGTGMGLAIAYGIIERHGGRLDVASTPGEGTCMRISLPRARHAPAGR